MTNSKAINILCEEYGKYNYIDPANYERFNVKRGLRNADGTGVMAGVTQICNVHGYIVDEGDVTPIDGELIYRGINIKDIVKGCIEQDRFGFEETIWLLLFGVLPTQEQLNMFNDLLASYRELPENFAEDMIIKAPSPDIMNKLARSVLALYSYDDDANTITIQNVLRQSIEIIARLPSIMVTAYQVKRRAYDHKSMYFHQSKPELSTAENILRTMRASKVFTKEEARLLDLCLILHAEHGGGNNSTFATRVLTSSGTDTYSAMSAGIGSLKGPRHGGANIKVMQMLEYIKANVKDWNDDDELAAYLKKIINKEAGDGSGLIYGMGHAVYTLSDPRAIILKQHAAHFLDTFDMKSNRETDIDDENPVERDFKREFDLLQSIERLSPKVFADKKGTAKEICANVDLYSGLIYRMLGIPQSLHTPLFAVARMPGWAAHRMEEMVFGGRIIRPAYKAISPLKPYIKLGERD